MPERPPPEVDDQPLPGRSPDDWDDDEDEDDDGPLDMILDPACWPDDDDEPTIPDGLIDESDIEDLPPLDTALDDDEDDDVVLPVETPLDADDLESLDAPDDTEIPVLPWSLEARIEGRPIAAKADPGRERTVWLRTSGSTEDREVTIEVAGKSVTLVVTVQLADQAGLLLGRDILSGRFLLRP